MFFRSSFQKKISRAEHEIYIYVIYRLGGPSWKNREDIFQVRTDLNGKITFLFFCAIPNQILKKIPVSQIPVLFYRQIEDLVSGFAGIENVNPGLVLHLNVRPERVLYLNGHGQDFPFFTPPPPPPLPLKNSKTASVRNENRLGTMENGCGG